MSTQGAAVPGTVVPTSAQVSPGGPAGISGANISADAGNIATTGSDGLILVPQSQIWSARLRSYNSLANPNFEVTQRNIGNSVALGAGPFFIEDRWYKGGSGTYTATSASQFSNSVLVPGTSYRITSRVLYVQLTGQETSMAASDQLTIRQSVEGSATRELIGEVSSISLLCYCNVALKFGVSLQDANSAYSITYLASIPASLWTLVTIPNIPAMFSSAGTFNITPGSLGYVFSICLAAGSSLISSANGVWTSGLYLGAVGQDNFCAKPVNTLLYIGFAQHEPSPVCTTLQDLDYDTNLLRCQRMYQKSYPLGTLAGTFPYATGVTGQPPVNTASVLNTGLTFRRSMAKTPTVTLYNHSTGAANSMQDIGGVNHAITSTPGATENTPFYQINSSALTAGVTGTCYFHWVGDTGW